MKMYLRYSVNSLFAGIILLTAVGCGGDTGMEYTEAQVKGTVSYKGKPLESGKIRFIPDGEVVDGQVAGKAVFADITDGKYSLTSEQGATVGKNRVEIISYRGTGKMVSTSAEDGKKTEEIKQFIPEDFNLQSRLSVDIKEGENTHDFDLK